MDFTTRLARKCGWEHTEKPEWTFLATDSFCFKNNFPSELQGQCPRLLTCWLNHAMVCNIQILFTTFVFHTLSWKKSKYAQNRWWQRFARAKSIKIYISVFPPPNKKRTLKSPLSPLIIKSTCLMTKQRLKGHLSWSRPSISWSLWLQFWPAAKAQANTRSKNRHFRIKKAQYLEAREAAKDNHNPV